MSAILPRFGPTGLVAVQTGCDVVKDPEINITDYTLVPHDLCTTHRKLITLAASSRFCGGGDGIGDQRTSLSTRCTKIWLYMNVHALFQIPNAQLWKKTLSEILCKKMLVCRLVFDMKYLHIISAQHLVPNALWHLRVHIKRNLVMIGSVCIIPLTDSKLPITCHHWTKFAVFCLKV